MSSSLALSEDLSDIDGIVWYSGIVVDSEALKDDTWVCMLSKNLLGGFGRVPYSRVASFNRRRACRQVSVGASSSCIAGGVQCTDTHASTVYHTFATSNI